MAETGWVDDGDRGGFKVDQQWRQRRVWVGRRWRKRRDWGDRWREKKIWVTSGSCIYRFTKKSMREREREREREYTNRFFSFYF